MHVMLVSAEVLVLVRGSGLSRADSWQTGNFVNMGKYNLIFISITDIWADRRLVVIIKFV